jgi:hypothetical protein
MSDYDVGYGKPPKHSQFKKGVCSNPSGRRKHRNLPVVEIMQKVLGTNTEFRDRGRVRKAARLELVIRKLVASAINGDVNSAAMLLKVRCHAEKYGGTEPTIVTIFNALPG